MLKTTSHRSPDISIQLDAPDALDSGRLCLEFANTLDWHASDQPVENLHSYQHLLDWAKQAGIRPAAALDELLAQAIARPALAQQVYAWAIDLREAIYRIFAAIAGQQPPAASDLELLNEALPHAYALPELVPAANHYVLRFRGDNSGLDCILWPIVRSAARLLTDGDHSRIGQCADDRGCGYLFYDASRNRSRRWCAMNSCGNRAKSQRHYARSRSAA